MLRVWCTMFLEDIFTLNQNSKGTRSGDIFARPNVDSVKKGDRSLRSFGPIVWNYMVPEKVKLCKSLDEFKCSIKTWTSGNCVCELCKSYIQGLGYISLLE